MPSAIAAHAAHANQVLDSTLVTPCQLPWIHPIESILRLYHSELRPNFADRNHMAKRRSVGRPSAFATGRG